MNEYQNEKWLQLLTEFGIKFAGNALPSSIICPLILLRNRKRQM